MKAVASPDRPRGIVLVVVLIMLAVIGLASAFTMKQALNSDVLSQNVRAEALAQEAAQIALAYCEQQAVKDATLIKAHSDPGHWNNLAHWALPSGTSAPVTLSKDDIALEHASFTPSVMPQCMAETSSLSSQVVLVTSRGFSPDYEVDASTGHTLRGAVVWLQSTIRLK